MIEWALPVFNRRQEVFITWLHRLHILHIKGKYLDKYELSDNIRAVYFDLRSFSFLLKPIYYILDKLQTEEGLQREERWNKECGIL